MFDFLTIKENSIRANWPDLVKIYQAIAMYHRKKNLLQQNVIPPFCTSGNGGALARSGALAHVRPRRRSHDDARTAQDRGVVQNNAVGGEALKCPVTPHPTRRRLLYV